MRGNYLETIEKPKDKVFGGIRVKVLQINAVNAIRSTGRTTKELADYLNSHGHDGYIAYSDGPSFEKGFRVGTWIDKKIHALNSRIFGKQAYYSKRSTRILIEKIAQLEPDVVHLRNLHSNYINLGLLLEFLAYEDIPTVITLHDCWFFTGKCTHYTCANCYRWREACGNCPQLKKDNKSFFFDHTSQMLSDKEKWFSSIPRLAVVGVSDWITNQARASILSAARILTRIYNWIDMDVFRPRPIDNLKKSLDLNGKFVILGVASRWSDKKGLRTFIDLSRFIGEDMRILLIGSVRRESRLPKNIIPIEETHNLDDLAAYYSLADVFLNPSLEETFGKVTAEALACGTPAIVVNSTANPELVGEDRGIVCGTSGTKEFLSAILLVKSKGKSHYSSTCIDFAKEHFRKNDRIKDYIDLYREIANPHFF